MNKVLHILREALLRPADTWTGYDATRESSPSGPENLDGYVRTLEQARERRGRLIFRR